MNNASAGISRERWHLTKGAQLRHEECLPLNFGSRQAAAEHIAWRHAQSRRSRETFSLDPNCAMVSSPVTPRSCHHGSILVPFHGVDERKKRMRRLSVVHVAYARPDHDPSDSGRQQRERERGARGCHGCVCTCFFLCIYGVYRTGGPVSGSPDQRPSPY
jgi:hypothetical protein